MNNAAPSQQPSDFVNLMNLAPNAMPVTNLMVAMIEHVQAVGLTRMRLRDSWLSDGPSGPQVSFEVRIGGAERGGANGALWGRARLHSHYLHDEDYNLDGLTNDDKGTGAHKVFATAASITFLVPATCQRAAKRLIDHAPLVSQSPLVKFFEAVGKVRLSAPPPSDPALVRDTLRVLAAHVEALRLPPPAGA